MSRFMRNQWCAFILTLSVLLAGSASLTSPSYAGFKDPMYVSDNSGGGLPGDPDGPGSPNSPGKDGPSKYRLSPGVNADAVRPVGDGSAAMRVWSWRLQIVLRSLASRWLR
jgi:hypothetical protein